MNAINRVVIVVLLLVVMALCSISLVLPLTVLDATAQQADLLLEFLSSLQWYVRVPLGILFAVALDIILILLIVLEVRRSRSKSIRVEKASGGEVQVSIDSIGDRLRYEIDQLAGVLRVKPQVLARRRGVLIELNVETVAGIDVPEKADQIVALAQQVVEERMGLKLARSPRVNMRAAPYPKTVEKAAPVAPPPVKPQEEWSLSPED